MYVLPKKGRTVVTGTYLTLVGLFFILMLFFANFCQEQYMKVGNLSSTAEFLQLLRDNWMGTVDPSVAVPTEINRLQTTANHYSPFITFTTMCRVLLNMQTVWTFASDP